MPGMPRLGRRTPKKPEEHWIIEYYKANPLTSTGGCLTAFGLCTIFSYHFHIEYSPTFDLSSLASVVLMAAFTGAMVFLLLSLLTFVPAAIIALFLSPFGPTESENLKNTIKNFFFSYVFFVWIFSAVVISTIASTELTAWIALAIATALVYGSWHVSREPIGTNSSIPALGSLRQLSRWIWDTIKKYFSRRKNSIKKIPLLAFLFFTQIFPLIVYFIFIKDSPIFNYGKINWPVFYVSLFWINMFIQIIGCYLIYAWREKNIKSQHRFYSFLLFLSSPLIITLQLNNLQLIPATIINVLKIGNFATTEITLTEDGCKSIYGKNASRCGANSDLKVHRVYIMSRIGVETYMKVPRENSNEGGHSWDDVLVPSKEISSYKIDYARRFYNKRLIDKCYPIQPLTKIEIESADYRDLCYPNTPKKASPA